MIMETKSNKTMPKIGAMKKRRVVMADGRRYLIYYSFEKNDSSAQSAPGEVKKDE